MQVICQKRKREDIILDPTCRFQVQEIADELVIGKVYTVYGMCLVDACLNYLIDPQYRGGLSSPTWYPAELFEVKTSQIPSLWLFGYYTDRHKFQYPTIARWGYPELVLSDGHFSGLQERNEKDMLIWLQRKAEINAEEAVNSDENV